INARHIKVTDIERWQIEAKLITEIAETRGHDVRIMYEIGIRSPKDLAKFTAKELLDKAVKAAETLGERVVSKSSMPNQEEVEKWIRNAKR
ncbi:MAG: DUF4332 domain-containing protein, partial [Candidatus Heimdallarchaeaceae archaeon]